MQRSKLLCPARNPTQISQLYRCSAARLQHAHALLVGTGQAVALLANRGS